MCFRPHFQAPLLLNPLSPRGPTRRGPGERGWCEHTMRQVGDRSLIVHRSGDTSLRLYRSIFEKIFVFTIEFCRCNKSPKKKKKKNWGIFAATKFCWSDKDFHNSSPGHSKQFVAAKCRRDMMLQLLSFSVYRPLGFYRNIS